MHRSVIACSLLALTVAVSGCHSKPDNSARTEAVFTIDQIHWNDRAVRHLREAIDRRAAHGLDRVQFAVDGQPGNPEGDRALTQSALRYASALARGSSDPAKLYDVYTVARPNPNLLNGLGAAMADGKVGEWLDGLSPQDDGYRALSKAYAERPDDDGPGASAQPT